ncbi:TonB-dependent receptor [[Flexibacter] sp. ATCC 35208]|uniref:SusC/RagA family TonB-linked outer membrane protein n=1 Tax=[Flexibacter] sp. ATCC 35208 TaxID=1936242 RepID=UPI0009D22A3B|nr:TonB-dependent receptor [[Flexibacter] sp. ATCC 35208]OMP80369.1 SusC/RagA family TonB-linked outer membrane protein [[Flexibacter] sp. ATCC 35208]
MMKRNNHFMRCTGLLFLLTMLHFHTLMAQQKKVTGQVSGKEGPLTNVSVQIKGTTIGAYTDDKGQFTISVPNSSAVLVVRYVGMETKEVPVGDQTNLNIVLTSSASDLSEVVVVGYGTTKRQDLTGSVGSVNADELMERPSLTLQQAMAGKVAGVNVNTNSGRPGGRTNVRIRGFGSIKATNDPLYVVDGIVYPADISTINPNDIESMDILKDASATAIYGTRGANGVIMITTKKGSKKGGQVSYSGYVSAGKMARKQDVLNSKEFLATEDLAYANAAKYDPTGFANGAYKDPKVKRAQYIGTLFDDNLNPLYDVDWQDAVTRTAISQGHNLSFTGGDEKSTYGLFLGYNDEQGVIKNSYAKRYTARATIDRQMNDWLKVGGSIGYVVNKEKRQDATTGGNNVTRQMIEMIPIVPFKYPDGTYGKRGDYEGMESGDNPLSQLYEDNRLYNNNVFNGNAYANIRLYKDLTFTSTVGANVRDEYDPYFNSTLSNLANEYGKNYAEITSYRSTFYQWENHFSYNKTIGKDHRISATAGQEIQKLDYLKYVVAVQSLSDDYYEWNNLGSASTVNTPSSEAYTWAMASFFARANYAYKDRYLVTFTGRYDGSSRFGADNKFAFFPSAAVGWRVSEEPFLKDNPTVNNLKLRASYGLTGNSEIGQYKSLANMTSNTLIFNGSRAAGTVISTMANPDLKWEKTRQVDVGFDVSLFDSRLNIAADYYKKNTKDLLLDAPVPASSGYTTLTRNIGSLQNSGFEFSVNAVNIDRKNFSWNTTLNFSTLKNKITALGSNNEDIYMNPNFLDYTNILRVGKSVSSFYGYVREGTWGTAEETEATKYGAKPGDLKFKDMNDDGQINSQDRTIIGKGIPDWYGTLSNTFRYKQFDFLLELQYSYGNDVFKLSEHSSEDRTGIANSFATVLNAWTPEHQNTPIAQIRPTAAGYTSKLDNHKVENGSFIRGKNISFGYNLAALTCKRLGVSNARVYVAAQNFFLITKYIGYDPETTTWDDTFAQGMQFHDYPKARTVMLGLNVTF